jgi:hypothetical protein
MQWTSRVDLHGILFSVAGEFRDEKWESGSGKFRHVGASNLRGKKQISRPRGLHRHGTWSAQPDHPSLRLRIRLVRNNYDQCSQQAGRPDRPRPELSACLAWPACVWPVSIPPSRLGNILALSFWI